MSVSLASVVWTQVIRWGRPGSQVSVKWTDVFLAQTQLLFLPEIMLHPNLPQQLDVRQAREARRSCFLIERREQLRPISPDLLQKCLLLFFGNSSSPFLDTPLISLEPVYGHPLVQPLWVLSCQFVESGP